MTRETIIQCKKLFMRSFPLIIFSLTLKSLTLSPPDHAGASRCCSSKVKPQRRQKANCMPATCSHGPTGASAESTEKDQLAVERNVREPDSLVADPSGAQQHIHTADYWLHIYTPLRLCLHIHANFRVVIVMLHVKTC